MCQPNWVGAWRVAQFVRVAILRGRRVSYVAAWVSPALTAAGDAISEPGERRAMGRLNRTVYLVVALVVLIGVALPTFPWAPIAPAAAQHDMQGAGRPEAFPEEILLGERYFHFDRVVPFGTEGLVEIGTDEDAVVFAESAEEPFERVFVSVPDQPDDLARYLPEVPLGPDGLPLATNACVSQPPQFGDLNTGDATYAYAGPEDDIPLDTLAVLTTTDEGFTVYTDPEQQPSPELLVDTGDGVFRFVVLDEQGRPPVLGDTLQFIGSTYLFDGNQTDSIDPATLVPVGCAGPFPVAAPAEQVDAGEVTQLYVTVNDRIFAYREEEQAESGDAPATADEVSTPVPDADTAVEAEATPPDATSVIATEEPATVPAEPEAPAEEPPATQQPAEDVSAEDVSAADLPLAVSLDGVWFALDRVVPIDLQALEQVGEDAGVQLFAAPGGPPFDRVYGALAADAASVGRYLAQQPIEPEGTCLAETANFTLLTVGEDQYAYAGPEPDLIPDQLATVFTTADGQPVYAETAEQPFSELYVLTEGVLSRFVLLDERGVPITVGDEIAFVGQDFVFDRDATGEIDPNALTRVGCLGPFPVRVAPEAGAGPFVEIFVVLNDETPRVLAFVAVEAEATQATPAALPTVAPAEPTIEAPTEIPTEVPTEIPTPTPVPPTETPVPPTATPMPPTETPVPPTPTLVPPTATPAPPTETPTPEVATDVPATEPAVETPVPEASPSPAPGTPEAPSDVVPTPLALPTVAPPTTPVSEIPVDAPAPIPETWPREIQVQGIRYLFDLEVGIDPQTLVEVDVVQTSETTLTIFAAPEDQVASARVSYRQEALLGPFGRVYAVSAATGMVVRYVSEAPITAAGTIEITAPCAAEAVARSFTYTFESQQYTYVFASVESTLSVEALRTATVDALGEVPVADDGREILVRAGGYPGLAEVFLAGDEGLERYIALNAAGVPVTLNDLLFAETRFRYEAQVSVEVSQTSFRRIGCAGPFPMFAPIAQAEATVALQTVFTVIETRVYQFVATQIVIAPTGVVPPPPVVVPPPPGYVQITLETTVVVGPTPTPLPNIRVIPVPGVVVTPTPATGVVAELPEERRRCQGDPGPIGGNGLPERLPVRVQFSGIAYNFVGTEEITNDIRLRRIGCVGPFEAVQPEGGEGGRVVYLRTDRAAQTLYRYEAATSFAIDFVVGGDPRVITAGDLRYVLDETWQRSNYSSVTVIVYAQDPDAIDPPRVFAVQVDGDVIAEYVPEGGDVVEASPELRARAEEVNINPDLVLGGGRRYLLVNLWTPIGTTTNGWVTLYAPEGVAEAETLLATDPRTLDLLVYRR
jgi:hypothetical protein